MTVKAGQKCTAISRAMAPAEYLDAVQQALSERLAKTKVGDPRSEDTRMGALVSVSQRDDVREKIAELEAAGARIVAGDPNAEPPVPGGAFLPPVLLRTDDPWGTGRRPRLRAVRAGLDDHALQGHGGRGRSGEPRQGQPGAVDVHPFPRGGARVRPGRGGLSRAHAGHEPR